MPAKDRRRPSYIIVAITPAQTTKWLCSVIPAEWTAHRALALEFETLKAATCASGALGWCMILEANPNGYRTRRPTRNALPAPRLWQPGDGGDTQL